MQGYLGVTFISEKRDKLDFQSNFQRQDSDKPLLWNDMLTRNSKNVNLWEVQLHTDQKFHCNKAHKT